MATFQVTGGALEGQIIVYPGGPDNSLPGRPPHVGGGPIVPPAPPVIWPPPAHGEVVPPIYLPPVHIGGGPVYPGRPTDPDYGRPEGGDGHPGHPLPPEHGHPDQGLPPAQGHPGQPLPPDPGYPSGGPVPPGSPTDPDYDQGHPRPPHVGGGPIIPPGVIYPPPGPGAQGKYLALVVVAVGSTGQVTYAWTVVDPSLTVGWPLPKPPPYVDNSLPPYAQPKG